MKPKNFPARKLARQIAAREKLLVCQVMLTDGPLSARAIRTKKRRGQ